jgi:hypothetical protein
LELRATYEECDGMDLFGRLRRYLAPVISVPLGLGLIGIAILLRLPWLGVVGGAFLMAGLLVWLGAKGGV